MLFILPHQLTCRRYNVVSFDGYITGLFYREESNNWAKAFLGFGFRPKEERAFEKNRGTTDFIMQFQCSGTATGTIKLFYFICTEESRTVLVHRRYN